MFTLYIKNQKIDLPDNFSILWSFKSKDLSAPTAIKNNFSKQINVKGTPHNNEVFNSLYRIEANYFTKFNPNIRNEFVLLNNGIIIESGYVQLNKISKKGSDITYSLTLFGGLGDFFYNLNTDEEGNKRTLYNLRWYWLDNIITDQYLNVDVNSKDNPINTTVGEHPHNILSKEGEQTERLMNISPINIALAWRDLYDGYSSLDIAGKKYTNVRDDIIFMPFDTGKPNIENFDCTSLLQKEMYYDQSLNYWTNIKNQCFPNTKDGTTYYSKRVEVGDNFLGNFMKTKSQRDLSQLEVGSLINTQMVPGIRISKLLDVICDKDNNGGYDVNIDAVKDDPIIKDGFTLLDRINAEDIENVLVLRQQVDTTLTLDTADDDQDSNVFKVQQDINFLGTEGIQISQLESSEIYSLTFTADHSIKSTFKTLFVGYDQTNLPWAGYDIDDMENNIIYPQINFPIFNVYSAGYTDLTHVDREPKTKKMFKFRGEFIGYGTATNVTYGRDWENFSLFSKVNYQDQKSQITFLNSQYPFDPSILYPVPWSYSDGSNNYKCTIYLYIITVLNEQKTEALYYVFPYTYSSYPPYSDSNFDRKTNMPSVIKAWLDDTPFRNVMEQKIRTYLTSGATRPINKGIKIYWNSNSFYQIARTTTFDLKRGDIQTEEGWLPSLVYFSDQYWHSTISVRLPKYVDYMYSINDVNCDQFFTITNSIDLYSDEATIESFGSSNSKIYLQNENTYFIASYNGSTTTIKDPTKNDPINYIFHHYNISNTLDTGGASDERIWKENLLYVSNAQQWDWDWPALDLITDDWHTTRGVWYKGFNMKTELPSNERSITNNDDDPVNQKFKDEAITSINSVRDDGNLAGIGTEYINKKSIFANTNSPYEYLISLAKLLNWKFDYNYIEKKVTIIHNEDYYSSIIPNPLTIDYSQNYEITPYIMNTQFIDLNLTPINSYSNNIYEKQNSEKFNQIREKNKYSFTDKSENLFKDIIFKSGSEFVLNTPLLTQSPPFIPTPFLGSTMVYRWKNQIDLDYEPIEIYPTYGVGAQNINVQYDYPMLSCYDDKYNYVSPKNIIVMFNGFLSNCKNMINMSGTQKQRPNYFGISKYIPNAYNRLNGGNPCYVNSILYYSFIGDKQWCYRNSDGMTWTPDIPYFTLYKFLDKNNSNLESTDTVLLKNLDNYYSINSQYNIKLRIKSRSNTEVGSGSYNIFEWPTSTTNPIYAETLTHVYDAPNYYNNTILDTKSKSATTSNKYVNIVNNITDDDARQVKFKAKLNTTPDVALRSIYTLSGGKYIITSIDNYDITKNNPFCDVTLQKIINI